MKALTTLTAIAALVAGISIAAAQNAPSASPSPSPNAANKGSQPETQKNSGSQSQGSATSTTTGMGSNKLTGTSQFCEEQSPGGSLKCTYASMADCEKESKAKGTHCVNNPTGTTGAK